MTYKEIINRFRSITDNHLMLQDFGYGDLSDLKYVSQLGTEEERVSYPYLYLLPSSSNRAGPVMNYSFNMIVMDMARPEDGADTDKYDNYVTIQSQCQQYIDDVLARLYYFYKDQPEITLTGITYTPFKEKYQDVVAGMTATITIQVPTPLNECVAPYGPMPGEIFVQYNIVPDADFTTGGFPPFATKVIDSLETTSIRPIDFTIPGQVAFNPNKSSTTVGQGYFYNTLYTDLKAEVEFSMTIECTQDFPAAFDFSTVTLSFYDGSFANTTVWPTITAVTGMPPSVPQGPLAGDQFTITTTAPFVIPVNQHTNTNSAVGGPVITVNNTWTPGINLYFKGISGQITYKAI